MKVNSVTIRLDRNQYIGHPFSLQISITDYDNIIATIDEFLALFEIVILVPGNYSHDILNNMRSVYKTTIDSIERIKKEKDTTKIERMQVIKRYQSEVEEIKQQTFANMINKVSHLNCKLVSHAAIQSELMNAIKKVATAEEIRNQYVNIVNGIKADLKYKLSSLLTINTLEDIKIEVNGELLLDNTENIIPPNINLNMETK